MSTTRPYPAGDCGPEPEGAATTAATPGTGTAGTEAVAGLSASGAASATGAAKPSGPGGASGSAEQQSTQGQVPHDARTEQPVQAPPAGEAAQEGGAGEPGGTGGPAERETGKGHPMRQVRRLRLVGVSGAVPRARDFVRQALQDWGWLPASTGDQRAAAEDVLLVVSELVTNACLHADGPEELRVGSGSKVLRLEIVDQGSGSPAPRTPHRAGRPGGHGMFIVQRLCLDWGVVRNPEGSGKTVWAELAAPS